MAGTPPAGEKLGRLWGVGLGPGDPQLLTLRAVEALKSAQVIFHVAGPHSRESVSERIVAAVTGCAAKSRPLLFSMSTAAAVRRAAVRAAAEEVAAAMRNGQDCAFATIGDPLVYSTFTYLQREIRQLLPAAVIEVVPGITCFQAAAAAWGEPLVEDEEVLTLVPRWNPDRRHRQALEAADTVVCLKTYHDRATVLDALHASLNPAAILYAARVGHGDQRLETEPAAIAEQPIDYLSLVIAKRGERA
ncbi:MAG: precorrin-2 C(20)-methyltransferase [Lentisphaeria bacterium]|jgi:precorrin-2/cobalt-factor-2 C20-methyltransferase